MKFGTKALGRGIHKFGAKISKPLNKLGSKHTLRTIGRIAKAGQEVGAALSVVAPEIGVPLAAASTGVRYGVSGALDAKSSVAAAKRGDMERAQSKGRKAMNVFV